MLPYTSTHSSDCAVVNNNLELSYLCYTKMLFKLQQYEKLQTANKMEIFYSFLLVANTSDVNK